MDKSDVPTFFRISTDVLARVIHFGRWMQQAVHSVGECSGWEPLCPTGTRCLWWIVWNWLAAGHRKVSWEGLEVVPGKLASSTIVVPRKSAMVQWITKRWVWGVAEKDSDWLGSSTRPHTKEVWTGKIARLCSKTLISYGYKWPPLQSVRKYLDTPCSRKELWTQQERSPSKL
jgi:hypothetical protein